MLRIFASGLNDNFHRPAVRQKPQALLAALRSAKAIEQRFTDAIRLAEVGRLTLNISGCINACGHHHIGNIGILGVEKNGEEFYQITLGGRADENASIGRIVGPGFSYDQVPDAVETVVDTYLAHREDDEESFVDTYARLGEQPFKEALYAAR